MFLYEPDMEGASILCLSPQASVQMLLSCPPPSWYRGAKVVIATSATAMNDMFPTVYGWAYGGELHAWMIAQMIH